MQASDESREPGNNRCAMCLSKVTEVYSVDSTRQTMCRGNTNGGVQIRRGSLRKESHSNAADCTF